MGLNDVGDFIRGELLEVIEWTDDSRDTLVHRFDDRDAAIKNGAQLIVRESQRAQFLYVGQFGDTFGPGRHTLVTENIPVLTRLQSWKYGFHSPFKADVYFLSTRLFPGNKWGTTHPIMLHDDAFGVVRVRAFGVYDFRIVDPRLFVRNVSGSDREFTLDEFAPTLQSRLVGLLSDAVAAAHIGVADMAGHYREIGDGLLPAANAATRAQYGVEVTAFAIENVSVPAEVEAAIDKRASMTSIQDLNAYVKYQLAQGLEQGKTTGAGGLATDLAMGLAVAQQVMQQGGGAGLFAGATPAAPAAAALPELLSPADAAKAMNVPEADVMKAVESGQLASKKIGDSYRITRAALQKFLSE